MSNSARHIGVMVSGAAASGKKLEVRAPFDQSVIGTLDCVGLDGVEQAFNTARALFQNKDGWLPKWKRVEILERASALALERKEKYALEAATEGGKPFKDSLVEVVRAADGLKSCAEELRTQSGSEIPMGITQSSANRLAFTTHEPIGIVVALSAFNHPFNLIVHQVGPAVAAGCPVIVKPASDTPLSCVNVVELLYEAGLPREWVQLVIPADRAVSSRLASHPDVAFLSFIGSPGVGWKLRSDLPPGARCALEHGGCAPVVVEDADIDYVLPVLVKGGFYHAGQVCVSVQRVYVTGEEAAKELANRIAAAASALKVGDPRDADTDVGPLIRHKETDRVDEWVKEAVGGGAELICGGKKLSPALYEPTVLLNPPDSCRVTKEEIFGPVVCVYSSKSIEESCTRANSVPFAFQAAVCTQNIDKAMQAFRLLNASAVMVNDTTAFRVDWMPFAGLRHSGHGVGGIKYTLEDMQVQKMMVLRSKEFTHIEKAALSATTTAEPAKARAHRARYSSPQVHTALAARAAQKADEMTEETPAEAPVLPPFVKDLLAASGVAMPDEVATHLYRLMELGVAPHAVLEILRVHCIGR